MSVLREAGLSIMCVIHQSRQLVFREFTHVLLLGEGGNTVYWGRSELLVGYLESLGFRNAQNENPADWMIDVCSGLETRLDPATGQEDKNFVCPEDLFTLWEEKRPHPFRARQPAEAPEAYGRVTRAVGLLSDRAGFPR